MSMNPSLLYLLASVCFIQALKGLSHPRTSIAGNAFGMGGMGIAVLTTWAWYSALAQQMSLDAALGLAWVLAGIVGSAAAPAPSWPRSR